MYEHNLTNNDIQIVFYRHFDLEMLHIEHLRICPLSQFPSFSISSLTVSIDCINTQPLYFPLSNLVLLLKRSQVSHMCTHQWWQNFKQTKWLRWGSSFSSHSQLPAPFSPSVHARHERKRRGGKKKRTAHLLPHKHITGPLRPVWHISEADFLCTDLLIQ